MSIERDCRKIHKKIMKFKEKYQYDRNITFSLKCNKDFDSYGISLYVNPQIDEYKVIKENLQLNMLWFTQRKELEQKYNEWIKENNVKDTAFNVITFLEGVDLLNREKSIKFLNKEKRKGEQAYGSGTNI